MSDRKKPTDSPTVSKPDDTLVPPGWCISATSPVTGESFYRYPDGRTLDQYGKAVSKEDRPEIHETFAPNAFIIGPAHSVHIPRKSTRH